MLYAERSVGSRFTKTWEWSPVLLAAVYAERFWKLTIKRSHGHLVSDAQLHRTRTLAGITNVSPTLSLPDIIGCLTAARQTRTELQKDSHTLRQNYLTSLAEALVLKRAPYLGTDPKYDEKLTRRTAKEVKRLVRLEHKRHLYRMIGWQLGDNNVKGGLSLVDIPAPMVVTGCTTTVDPKQWTGPWVSITDPSEIAQYVCAINTKQYNQAQHTPFGSGYLLQQFGMNLEGESVSDLLNGSFTVDPKVDLLPETHKMLKRLCTPLQNQSSFPTTITLQEFQSTYNIVKECTSSSISGRHVGHYKAAIQDDNIATVHTAMMSLPYTIGFSPTRWRNVVDMMLEKEPGNPKIHRLCIIALIESDYNQSQRILIA
jgi:hypothetical protein